MTKKTEHGRRKFTEQNERTLVDILKNQSQINVTEFSASVGFKPSSVKRHISRVAASMGLRIVGISKRDVCDIKKAVNDKHKKLNTELIRFVCICNGPIGPMCIKVSALDERDAKVAVEGEYPRLTVTKVVTQEEHTTTHRVKTNAPSVVRDISFGKSRSRRSII